MIKKELVEAVASQTHMLKSEVETVIDTALDIITENLIKGRPTVIRNFGTFEVQRKKAKKGYDFQRRCTISVPETSRPALRFSKELIAEVDAGNLRTF